MKRYLSILLAVLCIMMAAPALADMASAESIALTVNGTAIEGSACTNPDGALCLPLVPVAEALGYKVEISELTEGDAYRVVYTLTPQPQEGCPAQPQLMVAYSIEGDQPTAVAISKDQILLPLKQSMTLKDCEPYMPSEFFETGMCVAFECAEDMQTLNITQVPYAG